MINTLNETHLHKTLKKLYTLNSPGSVTETKVLNYIADIVTPQGNVIEIQTGNLRNLLPKLHAFLERDIKVTVVYPLVTTKYIETYNAQTKKITRRKSPRHNCIFDIFKELTSLCPFLLNPLLTIEVLETIMTEERETTREAVQSQNARRRFKKNWLKTGKRLDEIGMKHIFHGKDSFLSLLPEQLPDTFTVKDIQEHFQQKTINVHADKIRLMLWVFTHMNLLTQTGKKGRYNLFSITKES